MRRALVLWMDLGNSRGRSGLCKQQQGKWGPSREAEASGQNSDLRAVAAKPG